MQRYSFQRLREITDVVISMRIDLTLFNGAASSYNGGLRCRNSWTTRCFVWVTDDRMKMNW